jgi:hypothetical protein
MTKMDRSYSPLRQSLLILAAATVLLSSQSRAEDKILLRIDPKQISLKTASYLAEVGQPQQLEVHMNETIGDLLERHCGRKDQVFTQYLEENRGKFEALFDNIDQNGNFKKDMKVMLPYCLKTKPLRTETKPIIEIRDKNVFHLSGLDYYERQSKLQEWPIHSEDNTFATWMKSTTTAQSANIFETNPATWIAVSLKSSVSDSQVKAQLESIGNSAARYNKTIALLSEINPVDDRCPSNTKPTADYPIPIFALLEVLGRNRETMTYTPKKQPQIMIPDTGLPFSRALSDIIPDQAIYLDYYGRRRNEMLYSNTTYASKAHGLYVASASFGSAYFRRYLALLNFPLQLIPINIVDAQGHIDQKDLFNHIDQEKSTDRIVNISFSYEGDEKEKDDDRYGLGGVIDRQSDTLFVVAAGNSKGPIHNEYPAKLTSPRHNNLIVVASVDQYGKLAKDSSYSHDYVEIAAPGCRIPVYELTDDNKEAIVERSGTSLAGPIFSMTAALLKLHGVDSPYDIKKRCLHSGDYDPDLAERTAYGIKLNIVRALSIYDDVLTQRSGSKPVIVGKITEGAELIKFCDGEYSRGRQEGKGRLRSFTNYKNKEGKDSVFYTYETYSGDFKAHSCDLDAKLAATEITVSDSERNEKRTLAFRDIQNVTFSNDH